MSHTYCTRADIEAIWSAAAVLRAADDDQDGALSSGEEDVIASVIERAANRMNASLEVRYALIDLAGNGWCRDANAAMAAYLLATRRGNAAPEHIQGIHEAYLADLDQIRTGRLKVPEVAESQETIPTVTNFDTDLRAERSKVRRVGETSTGSHPPAGRWSRSAET